MPDLFICVALHTRPSCDRKVYPPTTRLPLRELIGVQNAEAGRIERVYTFASRMRVCIQYSAHAQYSHSSVVKAQA